MNKRQWFIFLIVSSGICEAQNLVPNGDFEQYSACPTNLSQYTNASFWIDVSMGTPDYFNQCNQTFAGIPGNYFGFQNAHNGAGYVGIYLYYSASTWHEYIQVPLTTPLVANSCYHFEMYINASNNCQFVSDAIGAYFSDTLYYDDYTFSHLPLTPQINNAPGNFPDSLNWIAVSGNYTATGGESYLIIGNFNDTINTNLVLLNPNASYAHAYVYIDDVSLSICNGVSDLSGSTSIDLYPNPFINTLNIRINNLVPTEITIYDITSRKLIQEEFTSSGSLNTQQLAKGIYLYELRNKNRVIKKGKVVKD